MQPHKEVHGLTGHSREEKICGASELPCIYIYTYIIDQLAVYYICVLYGIYIQTVILDTCVLYKYYIYIQIHIQYIYIHCIYHRSYNYIYNYIYSILYIQISKVLIYITLHKILQLLLEMQLRFICSSHVQRQEDQLRIKSAMAWVMLAQGIPIVYYGTEQNLLGHQPKAL